MPGPSIEMVTRRAFDVFQAIFTSVPPPEQSGCATVNELIRTAVADVVGGAVVGGIVGAGADVGTVTGAGVVTFVVEGGAVVGAALLVGAVAVVEVGASSTIGPPGSFGIDPPMPERSPVALVVPAWFPPCDDDEAPRVAP